MRAILFRLAAIPPIVIGAAFAALPAAALPKPFILHLSGSCSPGEMSIEYFIAGQFGGYSSFVKTDSRFDMYEIPAVRDGRPAESLKIIVRGARCRTQLFDIPNVERGGRVLRARLRRSRQIEFHGSIRTPELLDRKNVRLTVEHWSHWKCSFFGIADCIVGPTRIDSTEIRKDGRFKVTLPDLMNDPALVPFAAKGDFEFFLRDARTGRILYDLDPTNGSQSVPVASSYRGENEFNLIPKQE